MLTTYVTRAFLLLRLYLITTSDVAISTQPDLAVSNIAKLTFASSAVATVITQQP